MAEKRIIEQESSNEVYSDDWFAKDSPTQDTSKILGSDLKTYMNEGMTSADTIADEYDTSTSYDVGDLCFYNGTLYVCTTATTGAWDGNDWSETTIEELLSDSGKVQDVKVNGTSVVDVNKVAQIVSYKEVTQAEYNALPSSKNSDNVLYCIKDAVAPSYVEDATVNGQSLVTNGVAILDSLTVDGTASGAIATFSDGSAFPMKSLKVAIEPQQDLHGYDAPWVGGAGKNKLPMTVEGIKAVNTYHSWSGNSTTINNVTITIETDGNNNVTGIKFNGTASADITFNIASNITIPNGSYIWSNDQTVNISNLWLSLTSPNVAITLNTQKEVNVTVSSDSIGSAYIYASSGNVFNNIVFKPMIRLSSVSDSTFAPYSNICPISGWSEANVVNDSVYGGSVNWNQLVNIGSGSITSNGITFTRNADGSVTANGTADESATPYVLLYYSTNMDATHKYIVVDNGNTDYYCACTNNDITKKNSIIVGGANVTLTVQRGKTVNNLTITPQLFDITQIFGATKANEIYAMEQAQRGSGIAYFKSLFYKDYYPYNSGEITNVSAVNGDSDKYHTYTIDLDGTRYGGEVDVVSGVLTVDRAYVDLGTLTWSKNQTYWYNTSLVNVMKVYGYNEIPTLISSNYKTVKPSDVVNGREVGISNYELSLGGLMVYTGDLVNPPTGQLVYELATPTTIQLSPTQVSSLMGVNNIWAYCGDIINATYIRDLNITINNLINA